MAAKEKTNLLEVIPCRSEHITAEREGETIVLSFPRFKYSWMQRFLVPKGMSKERRIYLEEHGTAVWELIDGKCTVREIIENSQTTSIMKRATSRVSLSIFLRCRKTDL